MTGNKNNRKKRSPSIKIQQLDRQHSIPIAQQILKIALKIVDNEVSRVQRQRYLDLTLPKIAYSQHLINVEDFFHKGLTFYPQQDSFNADQEPIPISIDNLSHTHLEKSEITTVKSTISKSRVTILTKADSKNNTSKLKVKQRSVRLELEPIQQSRIVRDLRQRRIDDEVQRARRAQEEEQQAKRRAKRRNNQELNIGFDYSGNLLPRIKNERNNLVQKVIQLKLKKQKIVKPNSEPPKPEPVNQIVKKGYKKKDRSIKQETQFLEFLESQSLTDSVEINQGIRYQYNSLVFQEKKRSLSISDLKSSLGRRKMSKSEFARIQEYVQDKRTSSYKKLKTMKTENFFQRNLSQKRAFSQGNFNSSRLGKRQGINIINPELRQSMLIRLEDYQSFLVLEKEFPPDYEYYEAKDIDKIIQLPSKIQETHSKQMQVTCSTPRLPPLLNKPAALMIDKDNLVLTNLREQLLNKLRI